MRVDSTLPQRSHLKRGRRFILFAIVGGSVMLFGLAFLYILVDVLHMNKNLAYIIQAIISINLNFLLNYYITWSDRRSASSNALSLGRTWTAFILARSVTVLINIGMFAILTLYIHYLAASVISIIVAMLFNFATNDKLVFKRC